MPREELKIFITKITQESEKAADGKSQPTGCEHQDMCHMAGSRRPRHTHACLQPVPSGLMNPDKDVAQPPGLGDCSASSNQSAPMRLPQHGKGS